ncbi:MAG: hypothetical protein QXP65_02790 [Candidatus Hadarchaeales archaeon]
MRKLGQGGVATVAVVAIIIAVAGATVAAPVAVDAADVDPDHPLYALERLGERIRGVGVEVQARERWREYAGLVERGKGLEYRQILQEFVDKMREVAPGDVEAKQEVVRWMQEQMPGIGLVQLRLCREFAERLRGELADLPDVSDEVGEEIAGIENCIREWQASPELRENIRARLRLIMERLENIAERHRERIRERVLHYLDIDNLLVDVDVRMNVEVKMSEIRPPNWAAGFEDALDGFELLLTEVQGMLEGAPENAPGRHAAERLVEVAIELRDKAVAAYEDNHVRNALGLIQAARMHLLNAKIILERASEWEPKFKEQWLQWRHRWENVKQELTGEGIWENMLQHREQFLENLRQRWREKMP